VVLIGQNVTALAEEAGHNESKIVESDVSYSQWAEESIKNAVEAGLVPKDLQSDYTNKITRGEFCRLAVQTYVTKTGNEINMSVETPFTDIDDVYITTAYNLKIVSGVGNDKFAPNNYITRQEAAVMLNNLAYVLNIDNSTPQAEKFVDESYFADWAKSAIYSVAGIKSGDTYVMTGTGNGKFSPLMNYTREQAVATMYRLYKCQNTINTDNINESEKLTITAIEKEEDDVIYPINRLVNEGGEVVAEYPYIIDIGCGVYMYKTKTKVDNDIIIKAGLLNSKGEIIVNAEYDDITAYSYNNTITLKKDNTFYIYDNLGNLKKSVDYNLSVDGIPYEVVEATGSNIIVRQYVNKLWLVGIQPDQDYYIYRLYSQQKAADDYFNIRAIDNGEFIANDIYDEKICILDANGNFKKKINYSTVYKLDKGLYCAKENYDKYQGIWDLDKYYKQQGKVALFDDKFNIIEEFEDVGFEIDRDNRIVKVEGLSVPVEINY
ncbi:MAG: S-layer homology domain-containing protein, partial [Clostridia bacterium]|nr:S-layer homology domain-containing protein [Clostridia bacterium]